MSRFRLFVLALVSSVIFALFGCQEKAAESPAMTAAPTGRSAVEDARLTNFDDLDFNVFSGQKWDEFTKSHAANIVVHWPDGHTTTGLEKHIEDLKALFTWAPDTRITAHPIKLADGDYTAVTGVYEGTFTQPMRLPDGTVIPPTGKAFKLDMCTVGHWNGETMDEEYLFWDNQTFMQQVGLAK
jgi:hypothetical protein